MQGRFGGSATAKWELQKGRGDVREVVPVSLSNARIIHGPGPDILEMLMRRMPKSCTDRLDLSDVDAVGLIQTNVVNILYLGDIAQKAAPVYPVELNGSCPQHIVALALLGESAAVETAMKAVAEKA